jgi:hypothetical protein
MAESVAKLNKVNHGMTSKRLNLSSIEDQRVSAGLRPTLRLGIDVGRGNLDRYGGFKRFILVL